jgi:hypothetical protein
MYGDTFDEFVEPPLLSGNRRPLLAASPVSCRLERGVGRQNVDRTPELAFFSAVNHHQLWPSACATSHVLDLRSAGISPTDSSGQGHRADGAAPRGPLAQAAAPWSRALPTRRPSDSCCAQPSTSTVALALFTSRPRLCFAGTGSSRVASRNVGEPSEALGVPRSAMSFPGAEAAEHF